MLYVKNMIFFDGAITRLAPDVNLFEQVARIYGYFAQHHGERIVRDIGFDPRLLALDLDGVQALARARGRRRVAHPARAGRATAAHPGAASKTPESEPMAEQQASRAQVALQDIIRSGRPLAYIRSAEEARVTALLRDAARARFTSPVPVWTWSLTEGMRRDGSATGRRAARRRAPRSTSSPTTTARRCSSSRTSTSRCATRPRSAAGCATSTSAASTATSSSSSASPVKFIPDEIERDLVYIELARPRPRSS